MLTAAEAAAALGVSTRHIYRMAELGELPHRRLGKRVLIPRVVIDELCSHPDNDQRAT
jgi:excisionase family DNA binding protein